MRKLFCVTLVFWLAMSSRADILTTGHDTLSPGEVSITTTADDAAIQPAVHPVLAQGVLLIAGKNLLDPHFARTVILLTDYNDRGSAGLVLNRRTNLSAGTALPLLEELDANLESIYIGGPVAVNHIRLLARGDNVPADARLVVDNVFIVETQEALRQMEPERMHRDNIRVYMGYAGWKTGQLEMELLRGDWFIWPAYSEVIFNKHPENVWQELIYLATAKWI